MKNKNNKKRILVLNYEFPPLGGGGGVATHKLAKGFIENGYEVDYLTTWYKGLKKFEVVDGINVYRVRVIARKNLETATMISMLSFPFCAFWRGFLLCLKNDYSFINTQFVLPTGPLGFVLSKIFRKKNIISLHGGDIYDPSKKFSPHRFFITRLVVKFLLYFADNVVAQSSNTKENTIKYYKTKKRIDIIPLPYEVFDFKKISRDELGLSNNKKYIIGIGRLVKRKNFNYFIRVLKKLDDSFEGIIIGGGPERESLLQLAKELNVENRLHLFSNVSEEKKFQYLDCADIFVLSSLHEGFGIVLQEAMQVGLPIVATDNGGQVDFVKEGENGFLVPVGDVDMMVDRVNFVLDDEDKLLKIKGNNLEMINNFNKKNISGEYLKLIYG